MSGCPGWESVNPVCRAGQLLGGAASTVGNDVFGAIAHYFAKVADAMVSWLWQQLNVATSVDLTSANLKADLIATGAIAALITMALFVVQVIASALRQDPGGLGRAVRGVGVAFIGAAFAVASTQLLLAAVDGLCNGVVQFALGTNMTGMGSRLIAAAALSNIGNPAGLLLISLVIIAATVVVWVALMLRKMLIIVSAVFAPVAFSGSASDISRSWVRRWIEFTVALVFSKLILVIIFMIGLSVLNGAGQASSSGGAALTLTNLAVGVLTLLLAGFAPWIAIKMVHFAGDSFHAVHAQAATATTGARTVVAAPQKAIGLQQHSAIFRSPSRNGFSPSSSANGTTPNATGTPPKTGPTAEASNSSSAAPPTGSGSSAGPGAAGPVSGAALAVAAAGAAKQAAQRQVGHAQDVAANGTGPANPPQAPPAARRGAK